MPETIKGWSQVQSELATNGAKAITAQRVRDAIHSASRVWGGMTLDDAGTAHTISVAFDLYDFDMTEFANIAASVGVVPDKANDRISLPTGKYGYYKLTAHVKCFPSLGADGHVVLYAYLDGAAILGARSSDVATSGNPSTFALTALVNYTSGNGHITFKVQASQTGNLYLSEGCILVEALAID